MDKLALPHVATAKEWMVESRAILTEISTDWTETPNYNEFISESSQWHPLDDDRDYCSVL
jgi:hypothetical protein